MLQAIGTVFIHLCVPVCVYTHTQLHSCNIPLGRQEGRSREQHLIKGREQPSNFWPTNLGSVSSLNGTFWRVVFSPVMSVLASSSHKTRLFLLQLEPYLGGFFYFCFCRAELSEPVRLDHKLGKRNSFVSCSLFMPESFYNGFSKFLISPRDWAQVSQGRAVCAWCCVYSGLPGMLFF